MSLFAVLGPIGFHVCLHLRDVVDVSELLDALPCLSIVNGYTYYYKQGSLTAIIVLIEGRDQVLLLDGLLVVVPDHLVVPLTYQGGGV